MKTCSIPECERGFYARGWCKAHYRRWLRGGDAGQSAVGTMRKTHDIRQFYQEVVLQYEGDECLIWPFTRSTGYGQMKKKGVHRHICEDVYGPPPTPKHVAAHSCGKGNTGCVTKRHLRWATHKENHADMLAHGTATWGARNGCAKLTAEQVRAIRSNTSTSRIGLAAQYGISKQYVTALRNRTAWPHLEEREEQEEAA